MKFARALRAVTSLYPFNTPRASILARLPPIPQGYGEFRAKQGVRYRGYSASDDEVCRSLFWFGDFDPWIDVTLRRLIRRGSAAIDVGANIGATAISMAKAVGHEGLVFCFEPMPGNLERLRQNISANELTCVRVEAVALSDGRGELPMIVPVGHEGSSRIAPRDDRATILVSCLRFDEWLETHPINDISVCKIDVEGHEPEVFAGMEQALKNRLIPAFVFERHVCDEKLPDPIFDMPMGNGYRLLRIEKSIARTRYVDLDNPPEARPTADFVALVRYSAAERRLLDL